MTNEELPFIQAIREDGQDNTARYIFADWLEERGNVQGEFIRVQCQLSDGITFGHQREDLASRERELLKRHRKTWAAPFEHFGKVSFHKGLPERIELSPIEFRKQADAITDSPMIDHVRLLGTNFPNGHYKWETTPGIGRIRSLGLNGKVNSSEFEKFIKKVVRFDELVELDASQNGISANAIKSLTQLSKFPKLQRLNFEGNRLRRNSISALSQWETTERLKSLNLNRNLLTDAAMLELLTFPAFQHIDDFQICSSSNVWTKLENKVTDAFLEAWAESPNLARCRRLALQLRYVSAVGLDALIKSEQKPRPFEVDLGYFLSWKDAELVEFLNSDVMSECRSLVFSNGCSNLLVNAVCESPTLTKLEHLGLPVDSTPTMKKTAKKKRLKNVFVEFVKLK